MTRTLTTPRLHHDGLRSRALWLCVGTMLVGFTTSTVLLMLSPARLTGAEWCSFNEWLFIAVPGLYGLTNVGQRFASRGIPPLTEQSAPR